MTNVWETLTFGTRLRLPWDDVGEHIDESLWQSTNDRTVHFIDRTHGHNPIRILLIEAVNAESVPER